MRGDNPHLLLQDCDGKLSKWFASRPDARYVIRKEFIMTTKYVLVEGPNKWWHIWIYRGAKDFLENHTLYKIIAVGDYDTLENIKLLRSTSCQ